jgi:hypothetical protein
LAAILAGTDAFFKAVEKRKIGRGTTCTSAHAAKNENLRLVRRGSPWRTRSSFAALVARQPHIGQFFK